MPPDPLTEAAQARVVRLLTDRYADDTLTVEQFEAQLERMHALRDPRALDAMARELAPGGPAAAVAPAAAVPPAAGWPGERARRALVVLAERQFRGPRVVAGRWEVRAALASVVLDLREAQFPAGACELDLGVYLASVEVLLADGAEAAVDVDGVAYEVNEPPRGAPAWGPRVRVVGTVVLGSLAVRVAPPGLPPGLPFKQAWKAARVRR